jgi:SAM-dependent methyltransferase
MAKQDAAKPDFWETRYRERVMPWDAGGVPGALGAFLAAEPRPLRVLIPGCGSGYEARALVEAGHEVVAIDFSPAAIDLARGVLGPHASVLRFADFFEFDAGARFDLVYERAFLCALPRAVWPRYAPRVAELLGPNGRLAGFFFWSDEQRGPPFGLAPGELETLLTPYLERLDDRPVADSIPVFAGRERWQVWRRRAEAV